MFIVIVRGIFNIFLFADQVKAILGNTIQYEAETGACGGGLAGKSRGLRCGQKQEE